MADILVQIDSFTDDSQPGFVECSFLDAAGKRHVVHEKVPVVSQEDLSFDCDYPRLGRIACHVLEEWQDTSGAFILRVSTEKPFHIETTTGDTEFMLPASMVETVCEADAWYINGMESGNKPCHFAPVLVAVAQATKGHPATATCPYCASPIWVETHGTPPSAWTHRCNCGKCNGSFRGL